MQIMRTPQTYDVCVVGSGAGGAVLAAGLAEQGLSVVILEEGGHHTSKQFRKLDEAWSYPALYHERGTRATADLAITILQGRTVGRVLPGPRADAGEGGSGTGW